MFNLPKRIPFTKEGYQKLEKDLEKLSQYRKEVLVRLQAAREMGDLSENGAYKAARFELSSTDRELRRIRFLLRFGDITEKKNVGVIDFGSKIEIDDGKGKMVFTLVSGYESDPGKERLSVSSPLGKALVGKHIGDKVIVNAPDGQTSYTIVNVS